MKSLQKKLTLEPNTERCLPLLPNSLAFSSGIRIGYACKLLLESKHNIAKVGYESGFNNVSNFNRQFKKITRKSPQVYRKDQR